MAKKARALPVAKRDISDPRRAVFLDQLRGHGVVVWAAIAASPHVEDRKGAASSFYALRRRSADFSADWDDALAEANDRLIIEARRRAIEGVPRLRTHKDSLIYITDPETGEKRPLVDVEYSDKLLEILIRGGHPDKYIEKRLVEHVNKQKPSSWTITGADLNCLPDRLRDSLHEIMDAIRVARGEVDPDPVLESAQLKTAMIDITPTPKVLDMVPTDAELNAREDAADLEEILAVELPL